MEKSEDIVKLGESLGIENTSSPCHEFNPIICNDCAVSVLVRMHERGYRYAIGLLDGDVLHGHFCRFTKTDRWNNYLQEGAMGDSSAEGLRSAIVKAAIACLKMEG